MYVRYGVVSCPSFRACSRVWLKAEKALPPKLRARVRREIVRGVDVPSLVTACNAVVTVGRVDAAPNRSCKWHDKMRQDGMLHTALAAVAVAADDAALVARVLGARHCCNGNDGNPLASSSSAASSASAGQAHPAATSVVSSSCSRRYCDSSCSGGTRNGLAVGKMDWFARLLRLVATNDMSVVEEVLRVVQPYVSTGADDSSGLDFTNDKIADALRLTEALISSHSGSDLRRLLECVCGVAPVVQFLVALLDMVVRRAVEREGEDIGAGVESSTPDAASERASGDVALWLLCQLCDIEWERGASRGAGIHTTVRVSVEHDAAKLKRLPTCCSLRYCARRCCGCGSWLKEPDSWEGCGIVTPCRAQCCCRRLRTMLGIRIVTIPCRTWCCCFRMMCCVGFVVSPTAAGSCRWYKSRVASYGCVESLIALRCRYRPCPSCSSCGPSMATLTSWALTCTLRRTVR